MQTIVHIAQIVIAALLIVITLLQAKGGGLGGIFGGGGGAGFRTRRGLERRLFQATIVLGVTFILISMLSVRLGA